MIRYLLLILYLLSVIEATFELGLGLGAGLSAKNLLLYALVFAILARAVLISTNIHIPLIRIHAAFIIFVFYATLSWALHSLFDPTYPSFESFKALKNQMVDNFLFGVFLWVKQLQRSERVADLCFTSDSNSFCNDHSGH